MLSYNDYYKLYNSRAEGDYQDLYQKLIETIPELAPGKEHGFREKIFAYLRAQAEWLRLLVRLEEKWDDTYYKEASLEELKEDQQLMFGDIVGEAYEQSYTNPNFTGSQFGRELGPVMAAIAAYFRTGLKDAYAHRRFVLTEKIKLFFRLLPLMQKGQVRAEALSKSFAEFRKDNLELELGLWMQERFNAAADGRIDLICELDPNQDYYLYCLGEYVTEEEVKIAHFMRELPNDQIAKVADSWANAFRDSFSRDRLNFTRKHAVAMHLPLGYERVMLKAAEVYHDKFRLTPFLSTLQTTPVNRQYDYDHRFDIALVLDESYANKYIEVLTKLVEDNKAMLNGFGGSAYIDLFGETPFEPESKKSAVRIRGYQQALLARIDREKTALLQNEGDFVNAGGTLVCYPSPEIGEHYAAIFDEMLKINTMSSNRYEKVQQSMINALDRGQFVTVKGSGDNETDLTVALQPLEQPYRLTNFYNCLADWNVPLGEVFTSPLLSGTNGKLHVKEAYLDGLCFKDLKLTFEDGFVTAYSCANFERPEDNRRYISENILFPYETLPMGEFAIGTNTTAYCMAKKYDIMSKLPVLLIEKTGPHFALGDTCYAHSETRSVYNPDHKEIVARDNEKSIHRLDKPEEAYTGTHIDITLPIDQIDRLSVKGEHGDTDIIRGGRFVLVGTDILNEPMMRMEYEAQIVH